jgi:peptidoglycan/LPS O-acetylase OafA/YrhL
VAGINRNRSLDGIRGCLALLVFAHHSVQAATGSPILLKPATFAVFAFFMLSGCVLTRAWDGRYPRFLLGRIVRLWPVYALCLAAGTLFSGTPPSLAQFAWCAGALDKPVADIPAWSLVVEAWAMPFMPLFVWVARRSLPWLLAALAVTLLCAMYLYPLALYGVFFFVGAWASRFSTDWPPLEARLPQWLGRISYPLYLCHWPILFFLGLPIFVTVPLSLAVAALLTATVETWSIRASRAIRQATLRVAVQPPASASAVM